MSGLLWYSSNTLQVCVCECIVNIDIFLAFYENYLSGLGKVSLNNIFYKSILQLCNQLSVLQGYATSVISHIFSTSENFSLVMGCEKVINNKLSKFRFINETAHQIKASDWNIKAYTIL